MRSYLAAIAYNLKKYLKYSGKHVKTGAAQLSQSIYYQNLEGAFKSGLLNSLFFEGLQYPTLNNKPFKTVYLDEDL